MTLTTLPLFPDAPVPEASPKEAMSNKAGKAARVQMPDRSQLEMRASDLESLIAADHRVRMVWAFVGQLKLDAFYARIKAVEGGVGRSPIAPEILLSLWLYATIEGVGSARALARLCEQHDAYRWLCGGISVNYHTLADFRVARGSMLDELLTTSVASLLDVGAVTLTRVAQDGMRVRASAGSKSFRRRGRLEGFLVEARERVVQLKAEIESDPGAHSRREQAARERAAREREEKIQAALKRLPELERAKERQAARGKKKVKEARSSTTDAEATIMKMPNGGYNPAYNAQLCTDTESQIIVGVDMVTSGVDQGQMTPMLQQLESRYGTAPAEYLVDGGYVTGPEINLAATTCTVYAPLPAQGSDKLAPHEKRQGDSKAVVAWRNRMTTDEAKEIYKQRASTAECVNALARERGLTRLRVRGLAKTKSVLLLFALAHNILRIAKLVPSLLKMPHPSFAR
jgi:transposase